MMNNHNGDNESVNDGGSDDDHQRGYPDDLAHVTANERLSGKPPSQDLFYKNGGRSHESLGQPSKYRSEERSSNKLNNVAAPGPVGLKDSGKHHSHSMNSANMDEDARGAPPAFDKKILSQHRNSADSEQFNNKGNRKLRPAAGAGASKGDAMNVADKSKSKMMLSESVVDGVSPVDQQSSNSLDDLELHRTQDEHERRMS